MGTAISRRKFLSNNGFRYQRPLVFCCEIDGFTDVAVPLNARLAESLKQIEPASRGRRLEDCFLSCFDGLSADIVIRDLDVLFNPAYRVDVLALLVHAYRRHRFDVVWPGTFDGDMLTYAEEGYPDYRTFDIDRYDITCIF